MKFIIVFFVLVIQLFSANLHFSLYKKDSNVKENTLLVLGGIHGNEPGGYFSASFLEKYYDIKSGTVWIAPNLNFDSIISNERGIYGDMNRKFSTLKNDDPDAEIIKEIKKLILDKDVGLILNLHDGYGFYRDKYENAIFSPNAWGQATIIDQEKIHGLDKFGNLDEIATKVNNTLNKDNLFQSYHSFGVKNTQTKFKDEQMQLSLTYFAVTNNKPAFAIETSKNITDLTQKVIYQLKSIEEFMNLMNIKFERKFDINNYEEVKSKIYDFGKVYINDNVSFDLTNISKTIKYLPMNKAENEIHFEHSLGAFKKSSNKYEFYIGNIKVCDIFPQYFEMEKYNNPIKIIVDGIEKDINLASEVDIKNSFKISKTDFRVNIIGFSKNGSDSEDDIEIKKSDILKDYSIDKNSKKFRAEFYKNGKFYGMIILNFI